MRKYHSEAPVKKEESIFAFLDKLEDKMFVRELTMRTNDTAYRNFINNYKRDLNFSKLIQNNVPISDKVFNIARYLKIFYNFNYNCTIYSTKNLIEFFNYKEKSYVYDSFNYKYIPLIESLTSLNLKSFNSNKSEEPFNSIKMRTYLPSNLIHTNSNINLCDFKVSLVSHPQVDLLVNFLKLNR